MKKILHRHETYLTLIILLFSIVTANVAPAFLTTGNILSLLRGGAGLGLLSLAFFVALISGGIDISFPAIAISAQYITVRTMLAIDVNNILFAFLLASAIGIVFGLINAFLITKFNLPALIVTLGTFNLYHGGLLQFLGTESVNVGGLPRAFSDFGRLSLFHFSSGQETLGLSFFFVILVAAVILTWFILRHTMLGRGIYAIGGDAEAARRAGINVTRIQYFVYGYVGFLSAIMGIIHVSMIQYANPTNIVGTVLLRVIAAVILGGTSISGGRGTVTGTMLGLILIVLIDRHLIMLGVPAEWTDFLVGVVIVFGVLATHIRLRLERKQLGELIVERAH